VNERPRPPRDHVFILRLWVEQAPVASAWRAEITHVNSTDRRYFTNYGELCEFLNRYHSAGSAQSILDESVP
jgi:hypothetical protein